MADEEHDYSDEDILSENLDELEIDEELEIEEDLPTTTAPSVVIKVTKPEDRITSNVLNRFDRAKVIGIRAQQIANGDEYFTDPGGLTSPIEIADKELMEGKCPIIIERVLHGNIVEHWPLREMIIDAKI